MNAATLGPDAAHGTGASWRAGLALAALGVVYGDIGTSPLYAFKETLAVAATAGHAQASVLGLLSVIFWALTLVVTLKYVLFVLRADHDGEGGILSLQVLARHAIGGSAAPPRWAAVVGALGLVGAAMFYGDSLITPAISVLSAVEGLKIVTPVFDAYVVPVTLAVLVALFAVQRLGTGQVGRLFGPVMLLWFAALALLGVEHIARMPTVLQALDPSWAVRFLFAHPGIALGVLGSAFLAVTGGEALYADMGHFGAAAIRRAWFFVALPALVLNYFGQGALVLASPEAADSPFFRMVSGPWLLPLVFLATLATIIASQAVISGAYSMTAQAMRMGYLPRLRIVQTSGEALGQVYLPAVNWLLMAGVIVLVVGFGSSSALSAAYGVAVSITMLCTTLLAAVVAAFLWRWPLWLVAVAFTVLLLVDAVFVTANATKLLEGGWLPVLVAAVVLFVFTTWSRGQRASRAAARAQRLDLVDFTTLLERNPPHRVQGTSVFLTADADAVPHALLHNLKHNQVLHQHVVVLQVEVADTPRVEPARRLHVQALPAGFWKVVASHGFMEAPDVPEFVKLLSYQRAIPAETMKTSYFTSRESIGTGPLPCLGRVRKTLFAWLQRNAGRATDYFRLPDNRVVELGRRPPAG